MHQHQSEIPAPGRRDGGRSEVCLVLCTPDGVVAISKPGYPAGVLRLPTGGVQVDEAPSAAAHRELQEELGVTCELQQVAEITYADGSFLTYVFMADLPSSALEPAGEELADVRLVPVAGIANLGSRLEELGDERRPGTDHTWREWGHFRAVAHAVASELVDARGTVAATHLPARLPPGRPAVQVLGPVRVVHPGADPINLSGKHAQVLAALALKSPEAVSKDALREWFWEGTGTDGAIFTAVSRLRARAGLADDQLETVGETYVLRSDQVAIDSTDFTNHLNAAQEAYQDARLTDASAECRAALALWRGSPAGGELDDVVDAQAQVAALQEALLTVHELAVQIELDEGKAQQAALRAQTLCFANPFRESLWALYALALYRSGQQRAALEAVQQVRSALRDDAGLPLGPALTELERRILEQDPALLPPERATYRSDQGELQMYWGYRPAAHSDIRESLKTAQRGVVAAGHGLSTIVDILSDPTVVEHLAKFGIEVTLVMADPSLESRSRERGGHMLAHKVELSRVALLQLSESLTNRGHPTGLRLLTYAPGVVPRHFFLHTGHSLYVGSYLTHEQGSRSYLMKLEDRGDQLFALFAAELAHVLQSTVPVDLSTFTKAD